MAPDLKYPKPPVFTGNPSVTPTVAEFIIAVDNYFDFYASAELTDAIKLSFVGGFLSGAALLWYNEVKASFRSYEKFKEALRKQYQPFPSEQLARDALDELKYNYGVQELAFQFRSLLQSAYTLDKQEQIHLFVSKLPEPIRASVKRRLVGQNNHTLALAVELATQEEMFEKANASSQKVGSASGTSNTSLKLAPICHYCKQSGHYKSDCPKLKAKAKNEHKK